jgi:hypothetical protein
MTRRAPTATDLVRLYGQDNTQGVLSDHLYLFLAAGGTVRDAASGSGRQWAVLPDGTAEAVLCSDLVWVTTEDGREDDHCGSPAVREGACEGHAAEHEGWLAMTEADRLRWERDLDREEMYV